MKHSRWLMILAALAAVSQVNTRAWAEVVGAATPPTSASTMPAPQYWIGVAVENIGPSVAGWLKLTPGQGLVISKVMPGSPALAAGLQPNDLLIEIDGRPLLNQSQLVAAAQPVTDKDGPAAKMLTLTYLRGGDRQTVQILPQVRPVEMQIAFLGQPAQPSAPASAGGQANASTNRLPLKNGAFLDIGPGYKIDLTAPLPESLNHELFRQVLQHGQCVILSQSTDLQGHVKNSISMGAKTYDVTPENFATLPPEIQALARSAGMAPPAPQGPAVPSAAANAAPDLPALQKKVQDQQSQIAELHRQLEQLSRRLQQPTTHPAPE